MNISLIRIYRQKISMLKDFENHQPLGKCKFRLQQVIVAWLIRMAKIKTVTIANAGEDEKKHCSYIVGGNRKWYKSFYITV